MTTSHPVNSTHSFIDLATYDDREKDLYNEHNYMRSLFQQDIKKYSWTSTIPINLQTSLQNNILTSQISRSGDYLLSTWLTLTLPKIENGKWAKNIGHNIIKRCILKNADTNQIYQEFDSFYLDFWSAFTTPASKVDAYYYAIGNRDNHIFEQPKTAMDYIKKVWYGESYEMEEIDILVPLPFFWENTPLPTAAIPYSNLVIEIEFRELKDLLITDAVSDYSPKISNAQIHASYVVSSGAERKSLACDSRKILINSMEKILEEDYYKLNDEKDNLISYNIKTDNSVRGLMFGVRNGANSKEFSNYALNNGKTPIKKAVLVYESSQRFHEDSNYFTFLNPYHHAPAIPKDIGYHLYSYATDITGLKSFSSSRDQKREYYPAYSVSACGSTNYGKLSNVSITFEKPNQNELNPNDKIIIYALTHKIVSLTKGEIFMQ